MFSTSRKKARSALLNEARRQMFKQEVTFSEDKRPVSSVKALYTELNQELFGGMLPEIEVKMNGRLKKSLGRASYSIETGGRLCPKSIEIKKDHHWTPRFLRKVMIHEMCHVWSYQNHNEEGHGQMFWKKMKELGYPKTHTWPDALSFEKDIWS